MSKGFSKQSFWLTGIMLATVLIITGIDPVNRLLISMQTASPLSSGLEQAAALQKICQRPAAGSLVINPVSIRDLDASHPVNLTALSVAPEQNCYLYNGKVEAPTLRVDPQREDKTIVLRLSNNLSSSKQQAQVLGQQPQPDPTAVIAATVSAPKSPCAGGMPPKNATNLHFHGLVVSPECRQDETLRTAIKPGETFEYRVNIPQNSPPGLYWYHPHVHGQTEEQVSSGLTGAIIVKGIGKFNPRAARLPQRVLILRDMELSKKFPESDTEQPAKDVSINAVPIRYLGKGQYESPAVIQTKPGQEEFWRVANTSSLTYFDLQVTYDGIPQKLDLVGMDGVPLNADSGKPKNLSVKHILLAPAGRAEFMVQSPPKGVKDAKLLTLNYDTKGDRDPQRTLARIETNTSKGASSGLITEADVNLAKISGDRFSELKQEKPVKTRNFYFSQVESIGEFYITEQGKTPTAYSMKNVKNPDVTVQEGTTEDWIIDNQAPEDHVFHMHQIHFLVLGSVLKPQGKMEIAISQGQQ